MFVAFSCIYLETLCNCIVGLTYAGQRREPLRVAFTMTGSCAQDQQLWWMSIGMILTMTPWVAILHQQVNLLFMVSDWVLASNIIISVVSVMSSLFVSDITLHFKEKTSDLSSYFKYRKNILVGSVVSVANVTVNLELECASFCLNYKESVGYDLVAKDKSYECKLYNIIEFNFWVESTSINLTFDECY